MTPEDVPEELIDLARAASNAAPQKRDGKPTRMRHALAAVWPKIERQVRERVATELEERIQAMREDGEHDMRTVLHHIRDVTRGEAR